MKKHTRIYESLVILLFILFFCQLYILKGADFNESYFVEKINHSDYLIKYQINRSELPIGPVEGNLFEVQIHSSKSYHFSRVTTKCIYSKTRPLVPIGVISKTIKDGNKYSGYYAKIKNGLT